MAANTQINPSYFGYTPVHQTYDLTSMVDQIEGVRRNLPQLQFRIKTPLGYRDFIAEDPAQGIDGVDPASGTGQGQTVFGPNPPLLLSTASSAANANANTSASISLVWLPGIVNTNAVEEYVVQRATVISGPFSNIATTDGATTTYTDSTISTGTVYYYEVASVDSANLVSAPSNILSNAVIVPTTSFTITVARGDVAPGACNFFLGYCTADFNNNGVPYGGHPVGSVTGDTAVAGSTLIALGSYLPGFGSDETWVCLSGGDGTQTFSLSFIDGVGNPIILDTANTMFVSPAELFLASGNAWLYRWANGNPYVSLNANSSYTVTTGPA